MPLDKSLQLDQLKTALLMANICPELAAQATRLVMGDGNPDANIVFIGEAPGKKEDEQGLPFVGASGKFLNEMLANVGLERRDVYVTNIVKYRPPNNRDPTKAEKIAFGPYLAEQIKIIDPKIVVTLGRHSMEYFLPEAKIGDVHGTVMKMALALPGGMAKDITIVPLYHPAAALYNGSLRQTLMNDFMTMSQLSK